MAMTGQVQTWGARQLATRMGEHMVQILHVLDEGQRQTLRLDFADSAERTFWNYTPIARRGLALHAMDRTQRQQVTKLLKTSLSTVGYNTVAVIMALEMILDGREGFTRPLPGRDPLEYYLSLFGHPDDRTPWSWRFEGHHISLHFTIAEGLLVSPFPLFFGSNPGESELAGACILRPLHDLEHHARTLFHALDDGQRHRALLSAHAPQDIWLGSAAQVGYDRPPSFAPEPWMAVTGATPHDVDSLRIRRQPAGLGNHELSGAQQGLLQKLVQQYLERLPDELAMAQLSRFGDLAVYPMHFAWAGSGLRHEAHYYRIQAPDFLIEYDNYQNDANHIHAVWRDPHNDFGTDALAHHYATCH